MTQSVKDIKQIPGLNKTALNLFLFVLSFVAVSAILTWDKKISHQAFAGTLILVASCFTVLYFFLLQFRREVLLVTRKVFFILLALILFLGITRIVAGFSDEDMIMLIPFAIVPIVIRTFYDARLALFILVVTILLACFMVQVKFDFILLNFVAGMAAIFTLRNVYRKSRLFFTAIMVTVTYIVIWTGISLMEQSTIPGDIAHPVLLFALNGFLVLISYPLIFLFEQNFLLLSDATLYELADTNHPLLRKFAEEAPGSFQHSLQVANLAEEAARVIGANQMIVRVGSFYHDIGKIGNPKYFIENQVDDTSPHERLSPAQSAEMIISHVRNGVNLAKNYKLPVQIIDFIRMHHGTSIAYYFYKKYVDLHPDEFGLENIEKLFKYPGPKPFSKETAVVMMADAVEASSRSLSSFTEESINDLVERIIYLQEQDGQFSEVPLTFKDLSDIKEAMKKRLSNIYHARVAYPGRF